MAFSYLKRSYDDISARLLRGLEADTNGGCWLWAGAVDDRGYGSIKAEKGTDRVHRVSYRFHKGDIPAGMVVMHSCDVKTCCNPSHLSVGAQRDNVRDAASKGLMRRRK